MSHPPGFSDVLDSVSSGVSLLPLANEMFDFLGSSNIPNTLPDH